MELLSLFHKGGWIMYVLLLCSIVSIAIIISRILFYTKVSKNDSAIEAQLEEYLEANKFNEAIQYAEDNKDNVLARLSKAGLSAYRDGVSVDNALEAQAMRIVDELQSGLSLLSTIVTLAPILGLLGTVVGMIDSFSVLDLANGQPMAITNGVGEALIATASGLIVATIALVFHAAFSHIVNRIVSDMEQNMAAIARYVSAHKVEKENA